MRSTHKENERIVLQFDPNKNDIVDATLVADVVAPEKKSIFPTNMFRVKKDFAINTPEEAVRYFLAFYKKRCREDNKQRSLLYRPHGNLPGPEKLTLEHIIKNKGTRTFLILRDDLSWIDNKRNPTKYCPPIVRDYLQAIKKHEKPGMTDAQKIILKCKNEIERLLINQYWGGNKIKIAAYQLLIKTLTENPVNSADELGDLLERAKDMVIPGIKFRATEYAEVKNGDDWEIKKCAANTEITIQDALTWRRSGSKGNSATSDSGKIWKGIYNVPARVQQENKVFIY